MPVDRSILRSINLARPFTPRRPGEYPVRCWSCGSVLATLVDFSGHLNIRCRHCKSDTRWTGSPDDEKASERLDRLNHHPLGRMMRSECSACGQVLLFASIDFSGLVFRRCRSCRLENAVQGRGRIVSAVADMDPDAFMALMEERWQAFVKAQARRRAEVAVGLRFDVFKRDGFRCRYCGRSVDDGVILHADHVIPQSKGGPTTLENLVTACFECNIGKSNKDL